MNRKSSLLTPVGISDQPFWLRRPPATDDGISGRASPRRSPNLQVLVNHGLTYSIPSQVRDLSLDGAFIEMNTDPFPESSYLEVVLRYHYKGRNVELRLPAVVARVEGRGMAVRFGGYDDQTYTDLANLLYTL